MSKLIEGISDQVRRFSVAQASEYTGYSKNYIYKLTSQKRIPFYKPLGGRIFFLQSELDAFMLRGRITADYEVCEAAESLLLERGQKR